MRKPRFHITEKGKFLEIVDSKIHISLFLPLIQALTQHSPRISMQKLVEPHCDQIVFRDQLPHIRDLNIDILP